MRTELDGLIERLRGSDYFNYDAKFEAVLADYLSRELGAAPGKVRRAVESRIRAKAPSSGHITQVDFDYGILEALFDRWGFGPEYEEWQRSLALSGDEESFRRWWMEARVRYGLGGDVILVGSPLSDAMREKESEYMSRVRSGESPQRVVAEAEMWLAKTSGALKADQAVNGQRSWRAHDFLAQTDSL